MRYGVRRHILARGVDMLVWLLHVCRVVVIEASACPVDDVLYYYILMLLVSCERTCCIPISCSRVDLLCCGLYFQDCWLIGTG